MIAVIRDKIASGDNEERKKKARYKAVYPDIYIYTDNKHNMPVIIIKIGFSYSFPFNRTRSYIYNNKRKYRVIIYLDIKYKPPNIH